MPTAKLSVNVDHVATLREARGGREPDPVHAAVVVKIAGADGVTVHLRKDRRHIKEKDVKLIKEVVNIPLTLEMGLFDDILEFAIDVKPDKVTLVPERVREVTTERGFDLKDKSEFEQVKRFVGKLREHGIFSGLFVEPEKEVIDKVLDVGADFVELNTTEYAMKMNLDILHKIAQASKYAVENKLYVMAGHALSVHNIQMVAKIHYISEFSIGHSIISRSIFLGLQKAIEEIKEAIRVSRLLSD